MPVKKKRLRFQTYEGAVLNGVVESEKLGGLKVTGDNGMSYFVPPVNVIEYLPETVTKPSNQIGR